MSEAKGLHQGLDGQTSAAHARTYSSFNVREALSVVCRQANEVLGWRVGLLLLNDESSGTCQLVAAAGLEPSLELFLVGAGVGATADVFGWLTGNSRTGSAYVFERLGEGTPVSLRAITDDTFETGVLDGPAVVVPLRIRRKHMGILAVYDVGGGTDVEPSRLRAVEALAATASLLVEQAVCSDQSELVPTSSATAAETPDLDSLVLASQTLSGAQSLDAALTLALKLAETILPVSASGIYLVDESEGAITLRRARGWEIRDGATDALAPGGELIAEVLRGRTAVGFDPHDDTKFYGAMRRSSRSALAVPLRYGACDVGVLVYESDDPSAFSDRVVSLATGLAQAVSAAIQSARLTERLDVARREGRSALEPSTGLRERFESAADALRAVAAEEASGLLRLRRETPTGEVVAFVESRLAALDSVFRATALRPYRLHEPLEINRVVERAIDAWRPTLAARAEQGIDFELRFEQCRSARVLGCADELCDALGALIENAIEAQPNGGLLEIRSVERNNVIGVRVRDVGNGMSERVRARACEPFFTTNAEGKEGLGLSMALAIALRHGGRLSLGSGVGEGTSITLALPRYDGQPGPHDERFSRACVLVLASDTLAYMAVSGAVEWCGMRPVRVLDTSELIRAADLVAFRAFLVDERSYAEQASRLETVCRAMPDDVRCIVVNLYSHIDSHGGEFDPAASVAKSVDLEDLARALGEL
jgi:signal transduction histidine kinase